MKINDLDKLLEEGMTEEVEASAAKPDAVKETPAEEVSAEEEAKKVKDIQDCEKVADSEEVKPVEIKEEADVDEASAEEAVDEVKEKQEEDEAEKAEDVAPVEIKEDTLNEFLKRKKKKESVDFPSGVSSTEDSDVKKDSEEVVVEPVKEPAKPAEEKKETEEVAKEKEAVPASKDGILNNANFTNAIGNSGNVGSSVAGDVKVSAPRKATTTTKKKEETAKAEKVIKPTSKPEEKKEEPKASVVGKNVAINNANVMKEDTEISEDNLEINPEVAKAEEKYDDGVAQPIVPEEKDGGEDMENEVDEILDTPAVEAGEVKPVEPEIEKEEEPKDSYDAITESLDAILNFLKEEIEADHSTEATVEKAPEEVKAEEEVKEVKAAQDAEEVADGEEVKPVEIKEEAKEACPCKTTVEVEVEVEKKQEEDEAEKKQEEDEAEKAEDVAFAEIKESMISGIDESSSDYEKMDWLDENGFEPCIENVQALNELFGFGKSPEEKSAAKAAKLKKKEEKKAAKAAAKLESVREKYLKYVEKHAIDTAVGNVIEPWLNNSGGQQPKPNPEYNRVKGLVVSSSRSKVSTATQRIKNAHSIDEIKGEYKSLVDSLADDVNDAVDRVREQGKYAPKEPAYDEREDADYGKSNNNGFNIKLPHFSFREDAEPDHSIDATVEKTPEEVKAEEEVKEVKDFQDCEKVTDSEEVKPVEIKEDTNELSISDMVAIVTEAVARCKQKGKKADHKAICEEVEAIVGDSEGNSFDIDSVLDSSASAEIGTEENEKEIEAAAKEEEKKPEAEKVNEEVAGVDVMAPAGGEKAEEVKADEEVKKVKEVQDCEKIADSEDVKPVEIKESINYGSIREACMLDEDYFSTDSYALNTADEKFNRLTEQVALLIARESNDPMYNELLKEAIYAQRLQEAICSKYHSAAEEKACKIAKKHIK